MSPAFIGDQSDAAYLTGQIRQMQQAITALQVQMQFITTGGSFNLPTSDPHVVGQLWNDGGVASVSAG